MTPIDTMCIDDLQPGRLARGLEVIAQRVYHRLTTPRGALLVHSDFGIDLAWEIGKHYYVGYEDVLASKVKQELSKEEVLESIDCIVKRDGDAVQVDIMCKTADGPFALVLGVNNVSVSLLRYEV